MGRSIACPDPGGLLDVAEGASSDPLADVPVLNRMLEGQVGLKFEA